MTLGGELEAALRMVAHDQDGWVNGDYKNELVRLGLVAREVRVFGAEGDRPLVRVTRYRITRAGQQELAGGPTAEDYQRVIGKWWPDETEPIDEAPF